MDRAPMTADIHDTPDRPRDPAPLPQRRSLRERRAHPGRTALVTGAFTVCAAAAMMTATDRADRLGQPFAASAVIITATAGDVPSSALQPLPVAPPPNPPVPRTTVQLAPAITVTAQTAGTAQTPGTAPADQGASATGAPSRDRPSGSRGSGRTPSPDCPPPSWGRRAPHDGSGSHRPPWSCGRTPSHVPPTSGPQTP